MLLAAPSLAIALALGDAPPPAPAPSASLVVEVDGLRGGAGTFRAWLYASGDGFPVRPEKALRRLAVPISGSRANVVFDGLSPGSYAVAAYHDENGNGRLDVDALGLPSEGLASSNDARGFMGLPSFDDARVEVTGGEKRIVVRVVY